MVKFFLLVLLLSKILSAQESEMFNQFDQNVTLTPLESKISNYLGVEKFNANKQYIDILFTPLSAYYKNDYIDVVKVMQTLIQNKLFTLKLPYKQEIIVRLHTVGSGALFVKIMKDALRSSGYYRYKTLSSSFDGSKFVWSIALHLKKLPDIEKIEQELSKLGASFEDVEKLNEDEWSYSIDISHTLLDAIKVYGGEDVTLRHSLYAYWVNVTDIDHLVIESSRRNSWYPQVAVYDANLQLLKFIKRDKRTTRLGVSLPLNSRYIRISDIYTMKNIRDTLTLSPQLKSE